MSELTEAKLAAMSGPAATPVGTFSIKDAGTGKTLATGLSDWAEATQRLKEARREFPRRALKIVSQRARR